MHSMAERIIKHKKPVLIGFVAAILISAVLSRMVSVNYDLVNYLPEDSASTVALDLMNGEFTKAPPNARAFAENVTIPEAMEYKRQIEAVDGVIQIMWLDDSVSLYQPLEAIEKKTLEAWYRDGSALFSLIIDSEKSTEAVAAINEILGERGEISGDIVDSVLARNTTGTETAKMILYIVPVILLILLMTTSSWFEPVLFMIAIGVAIVINNGTNAFLGEVSFITKTTSSILQLAVSMDYSIFLLHRFREFRNTGMDVKEAMINAMQKSALSIFASGLTTVVGFGALIIMRFKIGPDLGIVLAKGVLLSMLSIMVLLPVMTVSTYKWIDKTQHKSFLPSFDKFASVALKLGPVVIVTVAILVYPAFLAQGKNDFMYGAAIMGNPSQEISKTEEIFGRANNMVILVPKGDVVKEAALCAALLEKPYISSAISYTELVGAVIPTEFVPENQLSELQSEHYSRIILTVTTEQEGPNAFDAVEEIRATGEKFYGGEYHLAGGAANVYDMRNTVIADNKLVTLIAILGIGLILLFTFRSLTLPIILLLTIESSIWVNLSFPYFMDEKTAYLGFMIISAIQLGATVDYAILFTNRYIENRKTESKKKAAFRTISDTAASIWTSAGILMTAGFIMGVVSTNGVVGQLGILIGRGTLLSAVMVFFFLPSVLVLLDKLIQKTTYHLDFYKGE